jgi:hypothetical protein
MYTKFLLFFLVVSSFTLTAQKLNYNVVLLGNNIGKTTVEKRDSSDGTTRYKLRSQSDAKVFFTHYKSTLTTDVIYKDGQMIFSYFHNIKEDEEIKTKTFWDKVKYIVEAKGEKRLINKVIRHTAIQLYFEEPKVLQQIFSERLGYFVDFVKSAEGVYECALNGGVTSIYRYQNGKLVEMEMKKRLGTVFLKLVDN